MNYYLDTEFIEGFRTPIFSHRRHHFIDLISIGIVAGDGRQYYAVGEEYRESEASEWVKENVLKQITDESYNHCEGPGAFRKEFVKSNEEIAQDIIRFVMPSKEESGIPSFIKWKEIYSSPEFYGYYADYDWVLLCSLFGKMIDLPKGFPMYCRDLKQMLDEVAMQKAKSICRQMGSPYQRSVFDNCLEGIKASDKYPKQTKEHNALADAKWNKELHEFIINCHS